MPSAFSLWAIALFTMSLLDSALSFRAEEPVPEIFRRKSRFEAKAKLAKRLVCIEDDVLLSFQNYPDDSFPFCSSYIGVPAITAVSTVTTRTTFVDLITTTQTAEAVATVPSNTVTVTMTAAPDIRKRLGIVPAAEIIASCTDALSGQNLTVISQASSACSCLFVPQTTVTLSTTVTAFRTLLGTDYEFATETSSTVTAGVRTVTVTALPVAPNTTVSAGSTEALLPSTTLASITLPLPANTTTTGSSDFNPTPGSIEAPPRAGSDLPLTTMASLTILPSGNTTTSASSDFYPTPGSIVAPPRAGSDLPSFPPDASSGIPTSSSNYTVPAYTSPSAAPTTPTNGSSPTTSGSAPSSTYTWGACPVQNGSAYTTNGQTFEIICFTEFIDVDDQGLYAPSLYDCINDCAIANIGFSQAQCYAASYIPNNNVGADCFFKTLNGSHHPEFNPKATSGILINNTLSMNVTASNIPLYSPSASPTNSLNSSYPTGPTAYPTASNITSAPYESVVSANATSAASSAFPTLSVNSTSLPIPPFPTDPSDPRNGGAIPSSGGYSTGFPSAAGNSSILSTAGYSTGFPIPTGNSSILSTGGYSTGFPTPTGNSSILATAGISSGFPSPTGNSSCALCSSMAASATLATITVTETDYITVSAVATVTDTVTVTVTEDAAAMISVAVT